MMRTAFMLAGALLALTGQPVHAADDPRLDANKKMVVEFYDKALNQKDFEAAAKYFGPKYIQHNPTAPDGIEPGTRGAAILDVFRLENGKIVEHWDVRQEIPEKAANTNGML